MSEANAATTPVLSSAPLASEIDSLLTAQLIVAWAGERGQDERRLGWWRTDLLSADGGRDLLGSLLPRTGDWAVLQSAREAARRIDEAARQEAHDSGDTMARRLGSTVTVANRPSAKHRKTRPMISATC